MSTNLEAAVTSPDVTSVVIDAIVQLRDGEIDATRIRLETALYPFEGAGEDSLDLDSLDALELMSVLEEHFDLHLPDEVDFEQMRTVGDVVSILHRTTTS